MYKEKPLLNWIVVFSGFLSGGLLAGFFVLQTTLLIKSLVFIYGLFVIFDALLPDREENDYPILALLGLFIGFLVAFGANLIKFNSYILIIVAITSIVYIYKTVKGVRS